MEKDLAEVAARFEGRVETHRVNGLAETETARDLGVMGTPTLIGFRGGEEMFRHTGRRSRAELESLFAAVAADVVPRGVGREDLVLRLASGAVLAGVGVAAGPVWPLVAAGIAITGLTLLDRLRHR